MTESIESSPSEADVSWSSPIAEAAATSRRRPRRHRPLKRLRRALLPFVVDAVKATLSWLPRPLAIRFGAACGSLIATVARRQRNHIEQRLADALGDHTTRAERRRIARGVFRHFGRIAFELCVFERWGAQRLRKRIAFPGWDSLFRYVERWRADRGSGVVMITPHFGNWELVGCLGSMSWEVSACIMKRYKVAGYQRIVARLRSRLAMRMMYSDQPPLTALRVLKRGGVLGVLPDLDAHRMAGVFAPFFGRDAYTVESPAKMSLRMGAPIIVMACICDGDGYRFVHRRALDPEDFRDDANPELALTGAWLHEVETLIRLWPEQWVWMHRRYASTPESVARRRARLAGPAVSSDSVSVADPACVNDPNSTK